MISVSCFLPSTLCDTHHRFSLKPPGFGLSHMTVCQELASLAIYFIFRASPTWGFSRIAHIFPVKLILTTAGLTSCRTPVFLPEDSRGALSFSLAHSSIHSSRSYFLSPGHDLRTQRGPGAVVTDTGRGSAFLHGDAALWGALMVSLLLLLQCFPSHPNPLSPIALGVALGAQVLSEHWALLPSKRRGPRHVSRSGVT